MLCYGLNYFATINHSQGKKYSVPSIFLYSPVPVSKSATFVKFGYTSLPSSLNTSTNGVHEYTLLVMVPALELFVLSQINIVLSSIVSASVTQQFSVVSCVITTIAGNRLAFSNVVTLLLTALI